MLFPATLKVEMAHHAMFEQGSIFGIGADKRTPDTWGGGMPVSAEKSEHLTIDQPLMPLLLKVSE